MPFGIGIWELLVLLGVLLLVFGPKRLPEMGRSLGRSVRELRSGLADADDLPEVAAVDLERPQQS
jgi:sec-independent protein translocase protein TatA